MIQKVSFRNFKAYRSLDLELEPFTVLVGPNASGKTTLLEGLHHFSMVANAMLAGGRSFLPTYNPQLQSYGVKAPIELSVSGQWGGTKGLAKAISDSELFQPEDGSPSYFPFRLEGEWNGKQFWVFGTSSGQDCGPEAVRMDRT